MRSGAYWAFGSVARSTCFSRLRGSAPVVVGQPADVAVGHYSAPMVRSETVTLTSTFPYGKGHTARETDTLSTRTHLVQSGHTVLTGGHTFRFSYGYPARAPAAPRLKLCAA